MLALCQHGGFEQAHVLFSSGAAEQFPSGGADQKAPHARYAAAVDAEVWYGPLTRSAPPRFSFHAS